MALEVEATRDRTLKEMRTEHQLQLEELRTEHEAATRRTWRRSRPRASRPSSRRWRCGSPSPTPFSTHHPLHHPPRRGEP